MGVSMCLQIGYQYTYPVHKIGLALSPFVILYQHHSYMLRMHFLLISKSACMEKPKLFTAAVFVY